MAQPQHFPTFKLRLILVLYRLAWFFCLPWLVRYLYLRSRREPAYFQFLGERFGRHRPRGVAHIWVHAVSLGEVRSAAPLIEQLLLGDTPIVTTHFTPAGRREAERLFADAIAAGRLSVVYVPFDYGAAFGRFFKAFRPSYGLVMEVEFWPGMIMSCRKQGVPLFLCNGQYPSRSLARDQKRLFSRSEFVRGFAGVMVKSEYQAARFRTLGVERVAITGEMRFEQPISQAQVAAAQALRAAFGARPVITLASVVIGEDAAALAMIKQVQAHFAEQGEARPLFVYVPRAPERFAQVADMMAAQAFTYGSRSDLLDAALCPLAASSFAQLDILLGDSLGEMYFYLGLCDLAIVGGGFGEQGSHNISEPLSLRKPVIIGPNDCTIEFPAREAIAEGVCLQMDFAQLTEQLTQRPLQFASACAIDNFLAAHGGSTAKTLAAIEQFMAVPSR